MSIIIIHDFLHPSRMGSHVKSDYTRTLSNIALRLKLFIAFTERRKKVPFRKTIGNGDLMHECFPKHWRIGTARIK